MKRLAFTIILVSPLAVMSALAANTLNITQKDKQFSKDDVTLKLGQTIEFDNDDTVTHNISVKAPDGSNKVAVVQKPGETMRVDFDQAGDWRVLCLVHPKMKIAVHVQ